MMAQHEDYKRSAEHIGDTNQVSRYLSCCRFDSINCLSSTRSFTPLSFHTVTWPAVRHSFAAPGRYLHSVNGCPYSSTHTSVHHPEHSQQLPPGLLDSSYLCSLAHASSQATTAARHGSTSYHYLRISLSLHAPTTATTLTPSQPHVLGLLDV